MSASLSNKGNENLWNKFTKSTKSISTSLSNLSVKSETDGSSVDSTLVHKALVKFYKEQVPFQGFPGWLGHKEDLPDEQKIYKKQAQLMEKNATVTSNAPARNEAKLRSSRRVSYQNMLDEPEEDTQRVQIRDQPQKRPTAGMSFQAIYSSRSNPNQKIQQSRSYSHDISNEQQLSTPEQSNTAPAEMSNTQFQQPVRTQSSSLMMRDRLKRQQNRGGFEFNQ